MPTGVAQITLLVALGLFAVPALADGEVTRITEVNLANPSPEVTGQFARMRPAQTAAGVRLELVVVRPSGWAVSSGSPAQLSAAATQSLISELVRGYREAFGGEPTIPPMN